MQLFHLRLTGHPVTARKVPNTFAINLYIEMSEKPVYCNSGGSRSSSLCAQELLVSVRQDLIHTTTHCSHLADCFITAHHGKIAVGGWGGGRYLFVLWDTESHVQQPSKKCAPQNPPCGERRP